MPNQMGLSGEILLSGDFLEWLYESRKRLLRETPKNHPNYQCNLVAATIAEKLRRAAKKDVPLSHETQQMIDAATYGIARETVDNVSLLEKLNPVGSGDVWFKWDDLLTIAMYINSFAQKNTAE